MSYTSSGYTIKLSDDTVLRVSGDTATSVISDFNAADPINLSDSSKTSLSLVRRGARQYSDIIATDLVHLLENFSKSSPPVHPLFGQLWFNKATNTLNLYNTSGTWIPVGAKSTGFQSAVTIGVSGDVLGSISFDGSTANSPYMISTQLATISTVSAGTYTNPIIGVDEKGRVISARNGASVALTDSDIINALRYTPVKKTGDVMQGSLDVQNGDINTSGKIKEKGADLLPTGMVMMWYGAITAIPSGWVLCDGTNGTPDLRDRFVVGAGSAYAFKDSGGNNNITTNVNNLNHTHSFTSAAALTSFTGSTDAHTLSTGEMPSHSHAWGISSTYPIHDAINGVSFTPTKLWSNNSGDHYDMVLFSDGQAITGSNGGNQGHSHSISSASLNLTHNHSGTTNNPSFATTPSVSFDNRPPYYALAYIMKT